MMKTKVLVADEEKFWREMAQEALEPEGYEVDLLDNYADLRVTLTTCPAVILLGFAAIGQREEETVRDALETCPEAVVLVLSTSWLTPQSTMRRLLRLGAADVLPRPSNSCDVVRLVERELRAKKDKLDSLSSYARFQMQGVT